MKLKSFISAKIRGYWLESKIKRGLIIDPSSKIYGKAQFGAQPGLVKIGKNCHITDGVQFLTHDYSVAVVNKLYPDETVMVVDPIEVKDNCFIGINAIILPGVTIGPNSIVGAGSVVNKDVPPNTVVAGNPAKVLRNIDDEYHEKLLDKSLPKQYVHSAYSKESIEWIMNRFKNKNKTTV